MADPCDICPPTVTLPSCEQVIRVTVSEGRGIPGPAGKSFAPDLALPAGSTLPTTGNYPGRSVLMDGYLYIWDGTQWGNGGLIRGPSGGVVQSWNFVGDGVKTTFTLSPEPTSQDKNSFLVERLDANGQFPDLLPTSAYDIVETSPRVWSIRFTGPVANNGKVNVRNFGVVAAGTASQWVTVSGTQDVLGDKTFKGDVVLTKGTLAAGNILTSDATGKASWAPPAPGPAGPTGPQGLQGPQGPAGKDGAGVSVKGTVATATALPTTGQTIGDMWIAADTGNGHVWGGTVWTNVGQIRGPQGPLGPQGNVGPQGVKGDKGDKGDLGLSILSGPSAPSGSTGNLGDFYIDTSASNIYGPKTAGGWGAATSLKGAKGDKGDAGVAGPVGPIGTVGPVGPKGDKGDKGDTGAAGPVGPQGNPGVQGPIGPTVTVSVGTVTTGAAGTAATVTNSGTATAAVFNFALPRGADATVSVANISLPGGTFGSSAGIGAAWAGLASPPTASVVLATFANTIYIKTGPGRADSDWSVFYVAPNVFRGGIDPTVAPPTLPSVGVFYLATKDTTTPNAGFGFAPGVSINSGDILAYDGSQWHLVPRKDDLNAYVPLAGGTMTGKTSKITWPAATLATPEIYLDLQGGQVDNAILDCGTF